LFFSFSLVLILGLVILVGYVNFYSCIKPTFMGLFFSIVVKMEMLILCLSCW